MISLSLEMIHFHTGLRRRRQTDQEDNQQSVALIIGIVCGIFGLYILFLSVIVAVFIFCFVRFNCKCVQCCGVKGCYKLDCSAMKCVRRPRVQCPKSVSDTATIFCNKLCPCCSNIDTWDSGELGFWIEIVLLGIVCFPFALCFLALYAYALSK